MFFYEFEYFRKWMFFEVILFFTRQFSKHPISDLPFGIKSNPDFNTFKIFSNLRNNMLDSILTTWTSWLTEPNFSRFERNIIKYNNDIFFWNFIKTHHFQYWFSWEVHIGLRFEEDCLFSIPRGFKTLSFHFWSILKFFWYLKLVFEPIQK